MFRIILVVVLCTQLVHSQLKDAIFVTTGNPNEESVKTELIDLGHSENVCSGLPNYPIALEGASGGLLGDKYPVVCGGLDYSTYEYVSDCIVLGKPELSTKLITGRAFSYGLEIGVDSLWITGGKGGEFGEELKSTEMVKINEVTTSGPDLPIAVAYHCMTKVDESTIMLIGGYQFESFEDSGYSGRTYNFRENAWTEGPTMKNVRGYFGCGSFNSNSHAGIITMAFGGWDGGRNIYDDSEILIHGEENWMPGPPLPKNMFQMATAPNVQGNGLYVIGGYSKGTGELSSLWEFTCPTAGAECQWNLLDQQLQVPRAKHVGFLINDNIFNCTTKSNK